MNATTFGVLSRASAQSNVVHVKQPIVMSSPDILSGTPLFAGTRVPVQSLIDYLEGGETIDDFLEGFPTVSRAQIVEFLDRATAQMVAQVP